MDLCPDAAKLARADAGAIMLGNPSQQNLFEPLERRQLLSANYTSIDIGQTRYFAFNDGMHCTELWKSHLDGSDAALVKDIDAGTCASDPQWFTDLNGELIFTAANIMPGNQEIWASDGTAAGTIELADIYGGAQGSYPHDLLTVNDHVVFLATNIAGVQKVFSTDGTEAGTVQLADNPIDRASFQSDLTLGKDGVYFDYHHEPHDNPYTDTWQTDGTPQGTSALPTLSNGTLIVEGTDAADNIRVSQNGRHITVRMNNQVHWFDRDLIDNILVHGGAGDDVITIDSDITSPTTVYGDAGNDTIIGAADSDVIVTDVIAPAPTKPPARMANRPV